MEKKFSIFSGDFSRAHPVALVCLVAFVLLFLTSGIFRTISLVIFAICLVGLIVLKIKTNRDAEKNL